MLYIVSGKKIKVWSLDQDKFISEINELNNIKALIAIPDKNYILTASAKSIKIWDLITLNMEVELVGHKG